jgi:hypothetical protein
MICNCTRYIDLSQPPYDEQTVKNIFQNQDCPGVGIHFGANPMVIGDCVVLAEVEYRILAVEVVCSGAVVWSAGAAPVGQPPTFVHCYVQCPVQIRFWLERC